MADGQVIEVDDLPQSLIIAEIISLADTDFGDDLANEIVADMQAEHGDVLPLLVIGINFDTGNRGAVCVPVRLDVLEDIINLYKENND